MVQVTVFDQSYVVLAGAMANSFLLCRFSTDFCTHCENQTKGAAFVISRPITCHISLN